MPELPEVETIKNAIQKSLKNAKILDVVVYNPNLRQKVPTDFPSQIINQKIIKESQNISLFISKTVFL